MLGVLRPYVSRILRRPALLLGRMGISPNFLTITGIFVVFLASYYVIQGKLIAATWIYIFSGTFDMLDGDLARLKGIGSKFGAILDSVSDRIGEMTFLGSLTFYFLIKNTPPAKMDIISAILIFLFMMTSVLISYSKARAEHFVEFGKKGLMQRTERMVLTFILLLFHKSPEIFIGILIFMNLLNLFTFIYRMFEAYGILKEKEKKEGII